MRRVRQIGRVGLILLGCWLLAAGAGAVTTAPLLAWRTPTSSGNPMRITTGTVMALDGWRKGSIRVGFPRGCYWIDVNDDGAFSFTDDVAVTSAGLWVTGSLFGAGGANKFNRAGDGATTYTVAGVNEKIRIVGGDNTTVTATLEGDGVLFTVDSESNPSTSSIAFDTETTTILVGVEIHDETLTTTGSFDVSGIDSGYEFIEIVLTARSTVAAAADWAYMLFNGDSTAGNYRSAHHFGGATHNDTQASLPQIGSISAATAPSSVMSTVHIIIGNYDDATLHKMALSQSGRRDAAANQYVFNSMELWTSTAAITRIALHPDGYATDLFTTGSRCQIIGYKSIDVVTTVSGVTLSNVSHPAATIVIASSTSRNGTLADYVCDGVEDEDTIMAAVAANYTTLPLYLEVPSGETSVPVGGLRVVLLEGVFYTSDPIDLRGYNHLELSGQGFSTIIYTAGTSHSLMFGGTGSSSAYRIHTDSYIVKGNANSGDGVRVDDVHFFQARDLLIQECGQNGMVINTTGGNRGIENKIIEGCFFYRNQRNGMVVSGGMHDICLNDSYFEENNQSSGGYGGLYAEDVANMLVMGCAFEDNSPGYEVKFANAGGLNVSGQVTACNIEGDILFDAASGIFGNYAIASSVIDGAVRQVDGTNAIQRLTISGNSFGMAGYTTPVISLLNVEDLTVTGNSFGFRVYAPYIPLKGMVLQGVVGGVVADNVGRFYAPAVHVTTDSEHIRIDGNVFAVDCTDAVTSAGIYVDADASSVTISNNMIRAHDATQITTGILVASTGTGFSVWGNIVRDSTTLYDLPAQTAGLALPTGTTAPSSPYDGLTYWNTTSNTLQIYGGGSWRTVGP